MERPPVMEAASGARLHDWTAIGRRVAEARKAAGYSQRRLAPLLGVERTTIGKLEAGKLIPSLATASRIGIALGAPEIFPEPVPCYRCGRDTFVGYCQGHGPHHEGAVPSRRDRDDVDTIGRRLQRLRVAAGLTQAGLGERVGVAGATIASIEGGYDVPSSELALAIGRELAFAAVEVYDLRRCPCSALRCEVLTVGGGYAAGHEPLSDESRQKVSDARYAWWASEASEAWRAEIAEIFRRHWLIGGGPIRALFEKARRDELPIRIPAATRQRIGQQWGGNTEPQEGRRGRQPGFTDEQADLVVTFRKAGLSIGQAAVKARVTKDQAAYILQRRAVRESV